ncbi:MAG: sulfur carrier protein ThiS [Candidatus Delongbacteria bacterium]|jgi:sulfur carrier protein|nr:sulfur carrier protein ThiS [Candidatus Delongbacteria bacterium]MDD4205925.1 sulfur carrier protein ThiS [Candidatus Delongbacteria bacterium]MDY0017864.1 sulfur carrier protein ThiS [Candidatus Delongbacteria bacterium]
MRIILNGISYTTDSENIFGLITEKGLNPSTVVVEYNGRVLKKEFWKDQNIAENDRIEILNFVGGG